MQGGGIIREITVLGKSYWMGSYLMEKNMAGWYIDHNCAIPLVLLLVD